MLNKLFSRFKNKETIDYVILGSSAAGINAAQTLRELDADASILIISKDEKIYSRCMLHHVISNHKTVEKINFVEEDFDRENNIAWIKGVSIKELDTDNKLVKFEERSVKYNKLLIATGASAFIPPIKNLREANFVYPLRNIEDVYKIKERIKHHKKVSIIGAGLVGIDALVGLLEYNDIEVALINNAEFILNRQLDLYSAKVYENKFIEKGAKIYNDASIEEIVINDNNDVVGVQLEDKIFIECDMIIVATGVSPNAEFIDTSKLNYDRGIVINDRGETNIKDVYAAGDVVGKNAIWPLAVKQGITAAYNMAGIEKKIGDRFSLKNSMNFMGIPTVSLGIVEPIDNTYKVVLRKDEKEYKKFIYKDDVIYGMIAQGDISYTGSIAYLIKNKVKISDLENNIFDIGYGEFLELKDNGEFCYSI